MDFSSPTLDATRGRLRARFGARVEPWWERLTPDAQLGAAEASALRSWESSGRVPLVWGHDARSGALLLEAIPSETPLSELGTAVELDKVARLIGGLHRGGAPVVGEGVVSLAERVEFMFEHWVQRHGQRGAVVTRAVAIDRLRRGHELARGLENRAARGAPADEVAALLALGP